MLILTRKICEALVLETPTGEKFEITVLGVKGKQVRLGIAAPEEINVAREELLVGQENIATTC